MEQQYQKVKNFVIEHKLAFTIGVVALIVIILAVIVGVVIYNKTPRLVYQPDAACDVFNSTEAKGLLGQDAINGSNTNPVLAGHTTTSSCSYSDTNPTQTSMIVAAVIVRSGIDDAGVAQNKSDFQAADKSTPNAEEVKDVGQSAFFNKDLGQLNIFDHHDWFIISYGVGSTPTANTVDDAVKMAKLVLN